MGDREQSSGLWWDSHLVTLNTIDGAGGRGHRWWFAGTEGDNGTNVGRLLSFSILALQAAVL